MSSWRDTRSQRGNARSRSPTPPPPPGIQAKRRRMSKRNARFRDPLNSDDEYHYYNNKRGSRGRKSYNYPYPASVKERRRKSSELTVILCVFRGPSVGWKAAPVTFKPNQTTDEQIWWEIREVYRSQLEAPWRRIFLFKHLVSILPIEFLQNDCPRRFHERNFPGAQEFLQCYRHPTSIRTVHEWVDWFVEFKSRDPAQTIGLEFVEGLWGAKLILLSTAATLAIIVTTIVWCLKGGEVRLVFQVMSFVLQGAAAQIALITLYHSLEPRA